MSNAQISSILRLYYYFSLGCGQEILARLTTEATQISLTPYQTSVREGVRSDVMSLRKGLPSIFFVKIEATRTASVSKACLHQIADS